MTLVSGYSFRVDQALHGYDGGHRLLALSRSLNSQNQYTALKLSDRSAPTSYIPPFGYLTGYPFPDDGVYVLSRTWAASEVKRPGSVWTHSLLIAFTDLAQLDDAGQLVSLFQKPNSIKDYGRYMHPLKFETSHDFTGTDVEILLARSIVTALYSEPSKQIFLTINDQATAESVVMGIWSQQWPRLRRGFRFCTLTSRDRSTSGHRFDLQLRSSKFKRSSHWPEIRQSRVSYGTDLDIWVEVCLQDLTAGQHPLRDFLRQAGGDLKNGRSRFAELCELYAHVSNEKDTSAIERILKYVEHHLSPDEGRLLRKMTIESAIREAEFLSDYSLITILPYLTSDKMNLFPKDTIPKVAYRYWEIDPSILLMPTVPSEIRNEFGPIVKKMTLVDIWKVMQRHESLFKAVLNVKPEVLVLPQIWSGEVDTDLIRQFKRIRAKKLKKNILSTVISADRRDLAPVVIDWLGWKFSVESLIVGSENISETGIKYLSEALTRSPNIGRTIGEYLIDIENPLSKSVIHILCEQVKPSDTIADKDLNPDPWATAWSASTGNLDAHSVDAVYIFFVERAFSLNSGVSTSLLSIAFDPILDRVSFQKISSNNRSHLSRLFNSSGWWSGSYERRFLQAIAEIVIAARLSGSQLLALSQNDKRLVELLKVIAETKRGRKYLRKLKIDAELSSFIDHMLITNMAKVNESEGMAVYVDAELGLNLPLKKDPIQFAVMREDGLSSNIWRVWIEKLGVVHLACLDEKEHVKISIFKSGKQRITFKKKSDHELNLDNKFWRQWREPPFFNQPGVTQSFKLVLPNMGLGISPESRQGNSSYWKKNQVYVKASNDKLVTVISLFVADKKLNLKRREAYSIPLGALRVQSGYNLWIVVHQEIEGGLKQKLEKPINRLPKALTAGRRAKGLLDGNALHRCLQGKSEEGWAYMVVESLLRSQNWR